MGKAKAKHIFKNYKSSAELYIAREGIEEEFFDTIKAIDEEILKGGEDTAIHLINDYGIGGIGKSTIEQHLIEKIDEENKKRNKEIRYICLDYEKAQTTEGKETDINEQLILDIMKWMKDKYNIEEFFCTACCLIKRSVLKGDTLNIEIENKAQDFMKNKSVKLVTFLAKQIPVIGSIVGSIQEGAEILLDSTDEPVDALLERLQCKVNDIYSDYKIKDYDITTKEFFIETRDRVNNIKNKHLNPIDLDEIITDCFVHDLTTIMMKEKTPFVFFFDTYENKINHLKEEKSFLAVKEIMLQEMIDSLPYVLWFISGRERLEISESEEWKNKTRSSHLIDYFNDDEIHSYFDKAEIDPKLIPLFSRLSGGIPLFLYLLYRTYRDIRNEGEKDFLDEKNYAFNKDKIISRYLNRMDEDMISLLKQIAIIEGGWTKDLLAEETPVIDKFNQDLYDRLIETSFIQYNKEKKSYSMPEAFRVVLLDKIEKNEPELKTKVKKRLCLYYKNLIENEDEYEGIINIRQYLKYATAEEKEEFFISDIYNRLKNLFDMYRLNEVQILLDEYETIFETSSNKLFKFYYIFSQGSFFYCKCNYKFAVEKFSECYSLGKDLFGEKQLLTLESQNNLALSLFKSGYYEEAIQKLIELYYIKVEILGIGHSSTLNTLNNIAVIMSCIGGYEEALEINKLCYSIQCETLGEKHLDTLTSLCNVAVALRCLGYYEEALAKNEECYRLMCEVLGEKHPHTLTILDNICTTLSNLGRYEEALEKCEECYRVQCEVLGEKHPNTLLSLNNLANTLRNLGRYNEALEMQKECYRLRQEVLGQKHPETLAVLDSLAITLNNLGRYEEALEKHEECYRLQSEVLGEKLPNTLASLNNMALCLMDLGRYEEALEKHEECYRLQSEGLGEKHPNTLNSLNNMALCLMYLGRYEEALEKHEECYRLQSEGLGEKHPNTLVSLYNLANTLRILGRYNEALEMQKECYRLRQEVLGQKHPETLAVLDSLAITLNNLGRYDEALEKCEECYRLRCEVSSSKHPDTLGSLNNMALCLMYLGRYDEALKKTEECYRVQCEVLGEKHPNTLGSLFNMALCLINLGRYEEALEMQKECYRLRQEVLGQKHPETLAVLDSLAITLNNLGRY